MPPSKATPPPPMPLRRSSTPPPTQPPLHHAPHHHLSPPKALAQPMPSQPSPQQQHLHSLPPHHHQQQHQALPPPPPQQAQAPPAPAPGPPPPAPPSAAAPVHHQQQQQQPPPPPAAPAAPSSASSAPAPPASADAAAGYRPLNVRDALSYLDQVKIQFSEQPDVYNRFLDIMKDFKSQAIDTPGVIERVSTLFKGHPMLISGFNTFLPPGYRIECSTDPMEPDVIRVTTPNGTTTTTAGGSLQPAVDYYRSSSTSAAFPPPPAPHQQQQPQQQAHHHHHPPPPHHSMPPSAPQPQHPAQMPHAPPPSAHSPYPSHHYPPPPPSSSMPPPPHPNAPAYAPHGRPPAPPHHPAQQQPPQPPQPQPQALQPPQPQPATPASSTAASTPHSTVPPAQMATSPLQNGKRSPVEFNHAINYVNKIKNRFANDPDTYKQFLEILQTYQKEQKPIQEVYAHVQYLFNGSPDLLDEFKQFLPDITGSAPDLTPSSATYDFYPDDQFRPGKKKRGPAPGTTGNKRSKMTHLKHVDMEGLRSDPYAFPASPFDPVHPTVSAEEVELFERIRKYIGNKPSYEEFLKTLNLYTQQIVTLDQLMDQVRIFIGSNAELFDWFQSVLAYEPKHRPIRRPAHLPPKPDLMHCAIVADSPSYRVAPVEWQHQQCSGRDQLAWEVLNDVYVSHPIWASEDDGFIASKKSQYEEAMHRCEEERYDYNMTIEANLWTIALLEPIAKKIEAMSMDEKAQFRLSPGLGGETVSIYERIIKKVYEKDRGNEIIHLLYENPAHVVPILLKRLHQKDEEWKKAQREWNKIWRELDNKNYYRALDYQGITFKGNDRKAMTVKAMTMEIEALHKNKKIKQAGKSVTTKLPQQFMFGFPDASVFQDAVRVVYSYIDRQAGFTHHDREKIRTFLRSFLPMCFAVDNVEPEGLVPYSDNDDDEMIDEDDDAQSTNTEGDSDSDAARSPSSSSSTKNSPSQRRHHRRGRNQEDDHTMDLLRDVLTKNNASAKPEPNGTTTTTTTTTSASQGEPMDIDLPHPKAHHRSVLHFFCNTTFYAFFRLFEMIYGRLLRLKVLDQDYISHPKEHGKKPNKIALQLGLYTSKYDDIDTTKGQYQAILDLIDRFFEGEVEPQMFEEATRFLFVTDAYILFTIDKLVHTFVKQIQAVTTDADSVELIKLFRSDCELETVSPRTMSVYRMRSEEIIGAEENLYLINFEPRGNVMSIQLVDSDDYMLEPTKEDRYEQYVNSYMDWANSTDGVPSDKVKRAFLQRNLPSDLNEEGLLDEGDFYVQSQLQYKIDQETYHMYYITDSEDAFSRPKPAAPSS
ncbi:hypothetical protein BC940DRAFT_293603 [Gongronella butleri]|nr:hypothetical protein BC940DRAFT_293603 [Gongronella butleri]